MELLKYINNNILVANAFNNDNIKIKLEEVNFNWTEEDLFSHLTLEVLNNNGKHICVPIIIELEGPALFLNNDKNKLIVLSSSLGELRIPIKIIAPGTLNVGVDLTEEDLEWNY